MLARFKDLSTGDSFEFDTRGLTMEADKGPWMKISPRCYAEVTGYEGERIQIDTTSALVVRIGG